MNAVMLAPAMAAGVGRQRGSPGITRRK